MSKSPYEGNPFNVFKQSQPAETLRSEQALAWEHARVACALGRLGLAKRKRELMDLEKEVTGVSRLSFARFHEVFPTFPMWLGTNNLSHLPKPLHLLQEAILPAWFRNFRNLPFIPPYEDFYDRLGDMVQLKPVGLVFPRKGFMQGLVIHNGDVHQFVPPKTPCFLYQGGGKKPMNLVVQPFIGLLDHIHDRGRGWKPEEG